MQCKVGSGVGIRPQSADGHSGVFEDHLATLTRDNWLSRAVLVILPAWPFFAVLALLALIIFKLAPIDTLAIANGNRRNELLNHPDAKRLV